MTHRQGIVKESQSFITEHQVKKNRFDAVFLPKYVQDSLVYKPIFLNIEDNESRPLILCTRRSVSN